ncbi:MAG: hypothetical protein ACLPYY_06025, partial [Acidimicrobiales bacterium]
RLDAKRSNLAAHLPDVNLGRDVMPGPATVDPCRVRGGILFLLAPVARVAFASGIRLNRESAFGTRRSNRTDNNRGAAERVSRRDQVEYIRSRGTASDDESPH